MDKKALALKYENIRAASQTRLRQDAKNIS